MVKPIQRSEIHGFSKGLVTEINPLNSQLDTTVAEQNYELHKDGTRSRRLGLDKELGGELIPTGKLWNRLSLYGVSSYLWEGADGLPTNRFVVLQIANTLYFFEAGVGDLSQTKKVGEIVLPTSEGVKISYGAVEGYLGVTTGTSEIYLVSYDTPNKSFSFEAIRIRIRDLFGIEEIINDKYEVDKFYRGPLNWQHYYNLYNQGWAIPRKDWQYGDPPLLDAVFLGANKDSANNSPSNSDIVWSGLANKPVQESSLEHFEAFHYRQFDAARGADTAVSKGFFLIDAFSRGSGRLEAWLQHRNNYPQTGGLTTSIAPLTDATTGGPTSVASHAGRLFYSGCIGNVVGGDERSPNYNNYVFFTQLIKNKKDFSKCYQEGDPTSRDSNDLVDTDGGFFVVSGAINIHTMYSMGDKLFLIAENGVWSVSGGSGYGFAATNYIVTKLSTFGGIPNRSFAEFGGVGFFWGWDGIYTIQKNQYGDYEVNNISKEVIGTFYREINDDSKQTCQGFIDKARQQVRWIYTEGIPFSETAVTKELILDLKFQAFIPFTITPHPDNDAYMLAGIQLGSFATRATEGPIYALNEPVYVQSNEVLATLTFNVSLDSNVKYLCIRSIGGLLNIEVAEYSNIFFEDWQWTGKPVDAPAFMETNAFTAGDFAVKKQVPYLTMAFAETEKLIVNDSITQESSCLGRFKWDFTHLYRSGKWSRSQQLYRKTRFFFGDEDIDTGHSLLITKTKIRGSGRSFSFRVDTEPLKDCHIYGWNLSLTGNNVA